METIVPGIIGRVKTGTIAPRGMIKGTKKPSKKQIRFIALLKEGNSPKKAAELAGYSQSVVETGVSKLLKNVNYDELRLALKPNSIVANHMAIGVAMRQMEYGDARQQGWGAKLALDNAKIHLADDKSPTSITFNFQTIAENVQVNVDKGGDK